MTLLDPPHREQKSQPGHRVARSQPALDHVAAGGVDLVLLDLGLPDMDGLDVCRQLRADGFDGGIVILTARAGELVRAFMLSRLTPVPFSASFASVTAHPSRWIS